MSEPSIPFQPDTTRIQHILLDLIDLDPRQSRSRADEPTIRELQQSIQERRLLEPIRVRLSPDGGRLLA